MQKSAADIVDNLDSLNNNELRARCMEYGLPNVPITDTSRKLLIRRLRAAIDGGPADPKSANKSKRRETIHVVAKVDEPEGRSSPKKVRGASARRTIAAASEPADEPTVELTVRKITQRRSSRHTPGAQEPITSVTSKSKADVIIEDVDEEEDSDLEIIGPAKQNIRSSRSPSLGKSRTVTTSYQHIVAPETIQEETVHSTREVIIPVQREDSYQLPKPIVRVQERSSPFLSRESPLKSRASPQLSRPSLASNAANNNYTTQTTSSSTTRRYTTSGYKPQIEYNSPSNFVYKPQIATNYANDETSEDNEEADEKLDSPYLSDFARRLSRLKAEPIRTGLEKEASQFRESQRFYTTSSIDARRGINHNEPLGESFRKFWIAIDRQYGLRKYLAIIAIILVALFIYIFFIQQN